MNRKTLAFTLIFSLLTGPALVAATQPTKPKQSFLKKAWTTVKEYALPIAAVAGITLCVWFAQRNNTPTPQAPEIIL